MDKISFMKKINISKSDIGDSPPVKKSNKVIDFINKEIVDRIRNFIHIIRSFFINIKNLMRWLPVIWKDRDWDNYYIYKILRFKLENTSKYLRKNDFFVGVERECQIIDTCTKLIKKLEDEEYSTEYFEFYNSDMKFDPIEGKDLFEIKFTTTRDDLDIYFNKYNRLYKKITKEFPNDDRHMTAIRMGRQREQKARRLLFNIMYERIDNWWD